MICNKTKIIIIIIPIDIAAAENHDNPKFNTKYVHIPYKEVYAQATIIVGRYTYFFVMLNDHRFSYLSINDSHSSKGSALE